MDPQWRILVVDDDPTQRRLLDLFLRKNHEMSFAEDLSAAREQITQTSPDIILLDRTLGAGEDGLDLVRWLRSQEPFSEIPVILLSGHDAPQHEQEALDAGATRYLVKPAKKADLETIIQEILTA